MARISEEAKQVRHSLGAFYTPIELSNVLVKWGLRSRSDVVLEPSFGGCGFIQASLERLKALGSRKSKYQVYGCDIDADAFNHLSATIGPVSVGFNKRFLFQDFTATSSQSFSCDGFDVVLGNPPYIGYSRFTDDQKYIAQILTEHWFGRVFRKPNLWLLFILQSLTLLNEKGRLAFVIPSSALTVDYAQSLLELISKHFKRTYMLCIRERLFIEQGTSEKCLILLAEEWNGSEISDGTLDVDHCDSLKDVENSIEHWRQGRLGKRHSFDLKLKTHLKNRELLTFQKVASNSMCREAGAYVEVKIGAVTGNKKFFVMSPSEARARSLHPNFFEPIVASSKNLSKCLYSAEDWEAVFNNDGECLLLRPDVKHLKSKHLQRYLDSYAEEDIQSNRTFQKRKNWYYIGHEKIPDLFLSCMANHMITLSINNSNVDCTNTIHRVYLKKQGASLNKKKALILSFYSSFSQLSVEMECRHRGNGALKIEPSDFKRVKLVLPEDINARSVNSAFAKLMSAFNECDYEEAICIADEWLLSHDDAPFDSNDLVLLQSGLSSYLRARMR